MGIRPHRHRCPCLRQPCASVQPSCTGWGPPPNSAKARPLKGQTFVAHNQHTQDPNQNTTQRQPFFSPSACVHLRLHPISTPNPPCLQVCPYCEPPLLHPRSHTIFPLLFLERCSGCTVPLPIPDRRAAPCDPWTASRGRAVANDPPCLGLGYLHRERMLRSSLMSEFR